MIRDIAQTIMGTTNVEDGEVVGTAPAGKKSLLGKLDLKGMLAKKEKVPARAN